MAAIACYDNRMQQRLFLMLGYPGSGKSTFAKLLASQTGAVRINSDEIRRRMFAKVDDIKNPGLNPYVFGALDYAAEAILRAGYSAIYDANNNRLSERDKSRAIADQFAVPTIVVWIKTPLEVAKQREVERQKEGNYLAIPEARYNHIAGALEKPYPHERVIAIDGQLTADEQIISFAE